MFARLVPLIANVKLNNGVELLPENFVFTLFVDVTVTIYILADGRQEF